MGFEFVLRLIGMVVLAVLGWQFGISLAGDDLETQGRLVVVLSLAGAGLGLLITPYVTSRPYGRARAYVRQMPAQSLVSIVIGLVLGLFIAALLLFLSLFCRNPSARSSPL